MKVTQGCYSFLNTLNEQDTNSEIRYFLARDWSISIEWTYDPHPRNVYWNMYGLPHFAVLRKKMEEEERAFGYNDNSFKHGRCYSDTVLGIDLGTTNSCCCAFVSGSTRIIPNSEGDRTTPSVVAWTATGDIVVGQLAKRQSSTDHV